MMSENRTETEANWFAVVDVTEAENSLLCAIALAKDVAKISSFETFRQEPSTLSRLVSGNMTSAKITTAYSMYDSLY